MRPNESWVNGHMGPTPLLRSGIGTRALHGWGGYRRGICIEGALYNEAQ